MSGIESNVDEMDRIGLERANRLRDAGFRTIEDIQRASMASLTAVDGIGQRLAAHIKEEARNLNPDTETATTDLTPEEHSRAAANASFDHLSAENRELLDVSLRRERLRRINPDLINPVLFPPCEVDILIVADGSIYFDDSDFGLETFVRTLLTSPGSYVEFNITLAHRDEPDEFSSLPTDRQMLNYVSDIARRIKGFEFDDSSHFGSDMYDQVWLFGINGSRNAPTDSELRAISEFMDGGGGLFATGDHGDLGKALSGEVPRARSMRLWDDDSGRVGMTDDDRNDTNRSGHDTSTDFYDQSDDIPQPIEPRMYHQQRGIVRSSFPHPLLCGPDGVIRVMPDHPHEGECVEPTDTSQTYSFDGYTIEEYPPGTGSSPRPLPEIISTSSVPAGNKAADDGFEKFATESQNFGGICAYDGHSAGVGRVVTDATWHHFLNVNLVGYSSGSTSTKRQGFLASSSGQDHLDEIKTYFRNIAVWISPESRISCMNTRTIWDLLYNDRVIEAVSTRPDITFEISDVRHVYDVGRHARDALGNYASQCQSRRLAIDLIRPHLEEELLAELDPWRPKSEEEVQRRSMEIPWTSPEPILELGLGGALIALREEFSDPGPDSHEEVEEAFDEVVNYGVERALGMAEETLDESVERFVSLW